MPYNGNVMGGRFVLATKDPREDSEGYKARFIIQGFKDKEKDLLINEASNVGIPGIRLLFALAGILGLQVWSDDVQQAYIQGGELDRLVYLNPKMNARFFYLSQDESLQVVKPLYGLTDSGDRWDKMLKGFLKEELSCRPSEMDPSLMTWC